jgi:hypothetical protein
MNQQFGSQTLEQISAIAPNHDQASAGAFSASGEFNYQNN